jgi:hypothetical protein
MRRAFSTFLLVTAPVMIHAQVMIEAEPTPSVPPSYQMQRYDEDYSCLRNSLNHMDWVDPAKYIPLRADDPSWYLTLGGELRERYEGNYDLNFGVGGPGPDAYWLQRFTLLTDWHLGDRVRFYAQGISALMQGQTGPAPGAQRDPADLEFAFMDIVPYLTPEKKVTLRAGRFGMSFGSGRLVDTRPPVNVDFRFDGVEAIYTSRQWAATAFLTQPARDSGGFDGGDHTVTFWGLYTTHWFDGPHTLGMDLYYFGIHRKDGLYESGAGDEHRHTVGTREFGQVKNWDFNAEEAFQCGSFLNESIRAWTASLDSGHTWHVFGQPRLGLKGDVASGDTHPGDGHEETFDALFFKSGYFNDASLLRPENIIDLHPNLTFRPRSKISVDGGGDFFWRYSRNDAIYAVPGFIGVPALHTDSSFVGTALDLNLSWQIQRHISLLASYVHFVSGSYVHAAGGGNVDYISTTLSFIF